jgi:hypothetical protein
MSAQSIFDAFNRCREWLLPALDGDTEDEVLNELLLGRAMLWEGDRAAVVTQCTREPPTFHLWLAGGKLMDVMALLPGGEAWARSMGLERVTVDGRLGWSRFLKSYGFVSDGELLMKAIR